VIRGSLLALSLIALGACSEQVPLGSWARRPGGTVGGDGGIAGGGGSSGASAANGGESGAAGGGNVFACRAAGNPQQINPGGDDVGVTIPYTDWRWPTPLDSLEWDLTVEVLPEEDGYLWSHEFDFEGKAGGLIGLQARGGYQLEPPLGRVEIADMVTIWISASMLGAELGDVAYPNARAAIIESTSGEWMTIHVKYEVEVCRTYHFRVAIESTDASGNLWYGTWVEDTASGLETYLGRIQVPADWGRIAGTSSNWTNRIGHDRLLTCADPEPVSAFFAEPSGNAGSVRPGPPGNRFAGPELCPGSRFTEFSNGIRQEVGLAPP
jgi:hypothetical protein